MYKLEHWIVTKSKKGGEVYHLALGVRFTTEKEAQNFFEAIKKQGEAAIGFNCHTELFAGPRKIDEHKFVGSTLK